MEFYSLVDLYVFNFYFYFILFHSSCNRMSEMIEYHDFLEVHRMYVGSHIFVNI